MGTVVPVPYVFKENCSRKLFLIIFLQSWQHNPGSGSKLGQISAYGSKTLDYRFSYTFFQYRYISQKKKVALWKNPEINKIYHLDSLLDGRVGGHAQVVVAAPHGDLLGTPGELPTEGEELCNYMAQIRTDTIVA